MVFESIDVTIESEFSQANMAHNAMQLVLNLYELGKIIEEQLGVLIINRHKATMDISLHHNFDYVNMS